MKSAGILLAAGASTRFGPTNKLLARLAGRPLVLYAAEALEAAGMDDLVAVTSDPEIAAALPRFRTVPPSGNATQQADSLVAGVGSARRHGAERVLILLGDMPFVTPALLAALLKTADACGDAASSDGNRRMPPAVFGRERFDALARLTGDAGARSLLAELPREALVRAPAPLLTDVDSAEDLQDAAMNIGPPRQRGNP